ncbi:hypothetical protein ACYF6T_15450 [Streptomyces sp. 7R007]
MTHLRSRTALPVAAVLTAFSDSDGISGDTVTDITGNGHTVTYDTALSANSALDGPTYALRGGGRLTPAR